MTASRSTSNPNPWLWGTLPRVLGHCDCGGVVDCIVDAAWSRGLGCVINSQGIMQSPRGAHRNRHNGRQMMRACIAIGWPDQAFPANAVVQTCKSVDEAAVFVGFDD